MKALEEIFYDFRTGITREENMLILKGGLVPLYFLETDQGTHIPETMG